MGIDSTALLIELVAQGTPPTVVLTADTGTEREETYNYLPIIQRWMDRHCIEHHIVRYVPKRFKNWPPYYSLLENILTNATLPSISLGHSTCSLKWKVEPQNKWVKSWPPALAAWERGQRVIKYIGYDASPADTRRYAHAVTVEDPLYDYQYPLRSWNWDRQRCAQRIREEGLPVPIKSACWVCAAQKSSEVETLPRWCLRLIVLVEARAAPRLHTVEGLWRRSTKTRPGSMTEFIRTRRLLDSAEIDRIIATAPLDLVRFQDVAADIPIEERPTMRQWIDRFNEGIDRLAA
ncbi:MULTISPECIES: hypothetical protein [Sphingobium]|uniref:hypothetical protein n=1 Tax=Sphingobium TaxID=165695 RepID=UPI00059D9A05|nr:hypothetical protein [Sphingobium indicum]